jgi:transcriptional regulator
MYTPNSFRVTDRAVIHEFMQANNFAAVISQHEGEIVATHLPLILDAERGEWGTLVGHMARANGQWKTLSASAEVMVMFQGAHTYITPSWYENHPSVPTWNYTVVHAYGTPRLIHDPAELYPMLEKLVNHHEANFEQPYTMNLPEDYVEAHLKAIVGLEIPISRVIGKFKLSQNRPAEDQQHVIDHLSASNYAPDNAVAELMRRYRENND